MKLKLILATMALAASAWAQSEQWLTYHTSSEEHGYQGVKLTTNAPEGVALPKLNGQSWFARWVTPMDPKGGRWLCLDHARNSGTCDRLYIDTTGNGRLDDKTPVMARVDNNFAFFPPTAMLFKGEDGPITYHLMFRFYQFESRQANLLASSACWYEGMVRFGDVKKRLQLFDGNVNGAFNDMASGIYDSDAVQIQGDKAGERYLGNMIEVDGKFFKIEVARDGAFVKVQKAENVVLGSVQVPTNVTEFAAYGSNGYYIRNPAKGGFMLPTGHYHMVSWKIDRKDDRGAAWSLQGYNFPAAANFDVAAGKAAELKIGEPVKAILAARESTNRDIGFDLNFVGQQKEAIQMLRNGDRPRGPKLMLSDIHGSLHSTNTFEFG